MLMLNLRLKSIGINARFILFIILILGSFLVTPSQVSAQSSGGISVTPSILRLDLETDPAEFELVYQNNSNSEVVLDFSATDFSDLEDGWKVRFLDDKESKNYHYSLSSWIEFEKKSITLTPGETGTVRVIVNKDELAPGGHYGSIMANISTVDKTQAQVDIKGVLSTIVFVRTNFGTEIEKGSISDLSFDRGSLFSFPKSVVLRFNNQGNTELVPLGSVLIKDMFGRTVAKGILNEGSNYSLPESIKRFTIEMKQSGARFVPGYYTTELDLKYGKDEKKISYQKSFLYIDPIMLGLMVIGAGVLFYLIKRLNRKIRTHRAKK